MRRRQRRPRPGGLSVTEPADDTVVTVLGWVGLMIWVGACLLEVCGL